MIRRVHFNLLVSIRCYKLHSFYLLELLNYYYQNMFLIIISMMDIFYTRLNVYIISRRGLLGRCSCVNLQFNGL